MSDFSILSTDIVHQILVSVPNFKSLLSLLLTSKLFNDVFEAHPHGIVRDVAHNQVGPALPQALRLVRCETAGYRFKDVADLPAEDDIMKQPITRAEARVLAQNAYVAYTLEDVFSRRHKDRSSTISQLTVTESTLFQTALYRLWLYSSVYGLHLPAHNEHNSDTDSDEDEDEREEISIGEVQSKAQKFLASFQSADLTTMDEVSSFFSEISLWTRAADEHVWFGIVPQDFGDTALYAGPRATLESYQKRSMQQLMMGWNNELALKFFSGRWEAIQKATGKQSSTSSSSGKIIGHTIGENDMCHRCNALKGFELLNEQSECYLVYSYGVYDNDRYIWSDWDWTQGLSVLQVGALLPGKLPQNYSETDPLSKTVRSMGYPDLLARLFREKEIPFDDLTEQDWLCVDCLKDFVKHHLCRWWLDHKRETGKMQPDVEDCWFGYNCRTMTHRPRHATRLNHLCVPTRGDE